jgi:hypothetical protein
VIVDTTTDKQIWTSNSSTPLSPIRARNSFLTSELLGPTKVAMPDLFGNSEPHAASRSLSKSHAYPLLLRPCLSRRYI